MTSFLVALLLHLPVEPPTIELPVASDDKLLTVAEESNFQATATHKAVMEFCEKLSKRSSVVHLGQLGKSFEGRILPMLILSNPVVKSAAEAKRSGKPVLFCIGDIHAGEVCGKEALMMLARDLSKSPNQKLLKEFVIVFAPIYNADGNERMSKKNRRGQVGPAMGMGQRRNAQGLDLNRDHMKLESPEAQALAKFYTDWKPILFMDLHTTNGSHHRNTITYDSPRHPATDPKLLKFGRQDFLPEITRRLEKKTGYKSFFYGNFNREHDRWSSYPAQPRYSTHYAGFRHCLGILSEAYAYASYKDRILATYAFVKECLELAGENKKKLNAMVIQARKRYAALGNRYHADDKVSLASRPVLLKETFTIPGYEEIIENGRSKRTDKLKDYKVKYFGREVSTKEVVRPYAYLIPAKYKKVLENLQHHGIKMEQMREDTELAVEVQQIDKFVKRANSFQGPRMISLKSKQSTAKRKVKAGTIVVKAGQELSNLIVNLLELESADGLALWDFFGKDVGEGKQYPVQRIARPTTLFTASYTIGNHAKKLPVTFNAVYGGGSRFGRLNLSGSPLRGLTWLPDGEHYLQSKGRTLKTVHAASGMSKAFYDRQKVIAALSKLPGIDERTASRMLRISTRNLTPDKIGALLTYQNHFYYVDLKGKRAIKLTKEPHRREYAKFSPDGKRIAFIRGYDLYTIDLETQTETAVTKGGNDKIRNGKAGWVYYEEIYGRRWDSFRWSPDGRKIVFMQFDESPVQDFTIPHNANGKQRVEVMRYPKAGSPNPTVKLGVAYLDASEIYWANTKQYDPKNLIISHYGFTPDSDSVFYYAQNRIQSRLDFNVFDFKTGESHRVLQEINKKGWVDHPGDPVYLEDNSMILTSEKSGFKHIYRYSDEGKLVSQITNGDWEVSSVNLVDKKNGWIYFTAKKDSPIADNFYRVKFDGSELTRLTHQAGSHRVSVSAEGKYFIDTHSSHLQPTQVDLHSGDGNIVRMLDSNPVANLQRYDLGQHELVKIPMPDGFEIEGAVLLPRHFDPQKKYPVWFMTYAGPHAPTVSDSWRRMGGSAFDHLLANMGIVVFRCDPRSASNRGVKSTWSAYKQLGVQELKDIEAAIGWLSKRPYIDAKRIGMSGHSYGGFMTAYAMTHSKLFKAGIAGAPVTDWKNYDSIYTERYMDTPQNNPEGYRKTSVVAAARNLHGKLLILHGAIDDNVHFQNTLQLVLALQRANKDFEMMVYPTSRHGIFGAHYRKLFVDFIKKEMLPDD